MAGLAPGCEILGAVKIKDGLFVGDELAAQDLEFVVANKVTRVINCAGRQVPNHWETIGVAYLTYYWIDADSQIILDQRDVVANETFNFVEQALEAAESVLIQSVRGQSRSCCILAAYMMKKYCWGLRKTMEFLGSRRPDLELKPAFLQQLLGYERRLMSQSKQTFSFDWNNSNFGMLECEELLLRNTYINSQMGPLAEIQLEAPNSNMKAERLAWMDGGMDDRLRLEKPAGADRLNLQACKRDQNGQPVLASVLKRRLNSNAMQERPQSAGERSAWAQQSREAFTNSENSGMPPPAGAIPMAWAAVEDEDPSQGAAQANGSSAAMQHASVSSTNGAGQVGYMHPSQSAGPPRDGPYREVPGPKIAFQVPSHSSQGTGGSWAASQAQQPQRGPTNHIRDSLTGPPGRRSSRDGRDEHGTPNGSRAGSREPSPKTNAADRYPQRGESPQRGDSPMRLLNRPGRGPPSKGQGPMSMNNIGLVVGSFKPGPSGGTAPGGSSSAQQRSGMTAFRTGGPVRAKADLLGDAKSDPLRRNRPATASPGRPGRAASPGVGQRSAPNSRPPSPQARAATPAREASPGPSGYPPGPGDRTKVRSLTSHMRRAPSPTPAFNRNPSGKPRWRS